MMRALHERWPATRRAPCARVLGAALLGASVGLTGCGVRAPAPGVEPGAVGRYEHVTFVPLLADDVRLEWNDGTRVEAAPPEAIGWDTRRKAGRIATELLAPTGTRITPLEDVTGLLPDDPEEDWPTHVWQRLRSDSRLPASGVVVILRQNAVDAYGRQYNPLADFLSLGVVGLASGAARREERFHPSFLLALNVGFHRTMIGASRCSIGFDARLLDAQTGEVLGETNAVLGQEYVPAELQQETWEAMSERDRGLAEAYCIAALRRGIAQALNELDVASAR